MALTRLPSPEQLGMPEKFCQGWRTKQADLLSVIITPGEWKKRAIAACAPTGFGKSIIPIAAAIITKTPTCIVTMSKGHQDQYLSDFAPIGLVDLRGRSNYQCSLRDDYTCEDGYAARCPYKGTPGCESTVAENRAAGSNLVVTNYDKWTASKKYGTGMDHFQQVIFDEGHEAPEAIARSMRVVLSQKEIEDDIGIDFVLGAAADDFANWKKWAGTARAACELALRQAWDKINGVTNPKPAWVKKYSHLRNLLKKVGVLATGRVDNWIVEEVKGGYQFDPINLYPYAENTLLLRVPKIVVLSATLRPKTMYMMGLGKDSFDFHEYDSEFDPRRCPIYYIPTMRVDVRNQGSMAHLWLKLDQIASKRRDRKGVIHTISYTRRDEILNSSRFADSMIINERGETPTEAIEQFIAAVDGTNLVSPRVGTGYDFADDICRWQFLCKIPFEPPSKIVKAREAQDPEYRGYKAMQYMVQAFGRDMRNAKDWSERFICDDHLRWFLPRFGHLAPRSFHCFFRTVDILPQPPRKEDMAA